jgi:hypothetical protein
LHVHSSSSADSINSPKTIIETAKKLGIGIALTDHNSVSNWSEAERIAKQKGVLLIKGEERIAFDEGEMVGEILGLFLTSEINSFEYLEVIDEIHSQDGLAVIAHPFDVFRRNFKRLKEVVKKVDAIECFNSRSYFEKFNKQAKEFARKHSLPCTAGSDAHTPQEIGMALTEVNAFSLEEIKKEIRKGNTRVSGRRTGLVPHFYTFLAKNRWIKEK